MSTELLGIPAEIEHNKKVFKLGPAVQYSKSVLEELLAANAIKTILPLKKELGADFQQLYDETVKSIGSGHYKTGSRGWFNSLGSEMGAMLFYLSLFRVNHPDMTADECKAIVEDHPDECTAAMARVAPGFFTMAFPKATPEQRAAMEAAFQTAFGNAK